MHPQNLANSLKSGMLTDLSKTYGVRLNAATITTSLGAAGGLGESGQAFIIGSDGAARTAAPDWTDAALDPMGDLARALDGETVLIEVSLPQIKRP